MKLSSLLLSSAPLSVPLTWSDGQPNTPITRMLFPPSPWQLPAGHAFSQCYLTLTCGEMGNHLSKVMTECSRIKTLCMYIYVQQKYPVLFFTCLFWSNWPHHNVVSHWRKIMNEIVPALQYRHYYSIIVCWGHTTGQMSHVIYRAENKKWKLKDYIFNDNSQSTRHL